ncbi:MAG: V-type ATPase 116kDa subunit family protein [Burkholderiales bacterium]
MIRPQPARWFEVLVARDDAARALEALASTGAAELEARPSVALSATLADLRPLLVRFAEFASRYRDWWPPRRLRPDAFPEPPATTLARCLASLDEWAVAAEPIVQQLQHSATERAELRVWRNLLDAMAGSTLDISWIAGAGPAMAARLVVSAHDAQPAFPPNVLVRRLASDGLAYTLVVGDEAELRTFALQAVASQQASVYEMPAWMRADPHELATHAAARSAELDRADADATARLDALNARLDLAHALGDAERLQWVIANVQALDSDDLFCRITGWTSELAGDGLERALEHSGARALLHFPPAPAHARAPLVLSNPSWARPFEVFIRALGMPGGAEADPTQLLAFVVPLMFGYMFGDVGQGLVIALAGFLLRARFPMARLLIAGGIGAALFGVLFGSVFGLRGIIEPLWIEPLDDPLTVLVVPLYGGAVLLTIGLMLTAVEAHWRGELRGWFCSEVWLAVVYVALLASVLSPRALYVAAAGAAAFCLGRAVTSRKVSAAFTAIAELVERTLQILINTLSFARVGAFALAHAGLSSAIVSLMGTTGSTAASALVLVVGNLVVLVLEGMVVSIQTTRLVLFEFFTRFLTAPGRVFRPLPPPPLLVQEP